MFKKQKGFTLIELVMVIVILGILAAVAIPKFVDLSGQAGRSAANGVWGAANSAAVINYANNRVNLVSCPSVSCISSGATLIGALTTTPDNWTVGAGAITSTTGTAVATPWTITISTNETTTVPAILTKNW